MHVPRTYRKWRACPFWLVLLMASCLLLAACQTVPYMPEAAEPEIEQPRPAEPEPDTEQPQPTEPEPEIGQPEPSDPEPVADPEPTQPTITRVEPDTAERGDVVMVLGEGFGKQAGTLRTEDGSELPIIYWSDERIDFKVTATSLPIRIITFQSGETETHTELTDEHLQITELPEVEHVFLDTDVSAINLHSTVTIRFAVQTMDETGTAISPQAVDWQLNNDSVAALTPTGLEHRYVIGDTWYEELTLQGLQIGTFDVTATVAGHKASMSLSVLDYPTGLSLQPGALDLVIGTNTEQNVLATLELASGATEAASHITWTSSDTRVADVENGVVTAVSAGQAVITAFARGFQASIEVSVTDPLVQLNLSGNSADLKLGDSQQLQLERVLASGTRLVDNGDTVWTSSNAGAISVTDDGLVTAHSAGTAIIRASTGGVTAELTVAAVDHVTAITIHRLNGTQVDQLLISGLSNMMFPIEVTARLHYWSGATRETTTELEWDSTSPQTARIEHRANYTIITPGNKVASAIMYARHPESGTRTHLIVHVVWPEANN